MDVRIYLTKIIQLLYRTRQIKLSGFDELVKSSMSLIKLDNTEELFLGVNKTKMLLDYVIGMLPQSEPFDLNNVLSEIEVILENDTKLFKSLSRALSKEMSEEDIKGLIGSICKDLSTFIREEKIINLFVKASNDARFNRLSIGDLSEYARSLMTALEPLTIYSAENKDPSIVKEVDFDSDDEIESVFTNVLDRQNSTGIYKLGHQKLNRMTQGGILPGELVTIGALQHNFKSGMSLSLTAQILTSNKPIIEEHEKHLKPLIVRISLEDPLENNFQFLFQYLKYQEGIELTTKELSRYTSKEMTQYIKSKLTATGFSFKALRIDPSDFGFTNLFDLVIGYEALGYKVCGVIVDYALMMSTKNCIQGPAGSDKRDLLRRIRSFMSARGIFFITPLQLSTEATQLVRNGVTGMSFLNEISSKSYYDSCKTLAQEIDLELCQTLFKHDNKTFIGVALGKHRRAGIVEKEEWKNFMIPFENRKTPLKEDLHGEELGYYSLPRAGGSGDMYNEIFM